MSIGPLNLGDMARWAFWSPFRSLLSGNRPNHIQHLHALWRIQYLGTKKQHGVMKDELLKCFPNTHTSTIVSEAYRCAWRVHLEELLIGSLRKESVHHYITTSGENNLKEALNIGKGVILLYPHAGPVMMMMAWLAYNDYSYVQYAARGLPPVEMAEAHPELLAHNWFKEETRKARETAEDKLPVEFVTLEQSARPLFRALSENKIVGIAYDGRIGKRWKAFPYLNREALLSTGPYRLAQRCDATIVPAFCHTPPNGPSICTFSKPIRPQENWTKTASEFLKVMEEHINQHPEEYALWLLHCRQRCSIDDHPLFIDQSPDSRHLKWL